MLSFSPSPSLSGSEAAFFVRLLAMARSRNLPLSTAVEASTGLAGLPQLARLLPVLRKAGEDEILDEAGAALERGRDWAAAGILDTLRHASLPAAGLLDLARWLAGRAEERGRFLGAVGYPLTLAATACLVGALVTQAAVGTVFFDSLGNELGTAGQLAATDEGPGPVVRLILAFQGLVTDPVGMWAFAFGVLALVIAVAWAGTSLPDLRVALWVPGLGRYVRISAARSFCSSLHVLLRTGVPLPEALELAAGTVSNRHLGRLLLPLADTVRRGESLGEAFRRTSVLPPSTAWRLWSAYYRSDLPGELRRAGDGLRAELRVLESRITASASLASWVLAFVVLAPIVFSVYALMSSMLRLLAGIG